MPVIPHTLEEEAKDILSFAQKKLTRLYIKNKIKLGAGGSCL
jgi:hypothetical protein